MQLCQTPPVNQPADQVLHDGICHTRQVTRDHGERILAADRIPSPPPHWERSESVCSLLLLAVLWGAAQTDSMVLIMQRRPRRADETDLVAPSSTNDGRRVLHTHQDLPPALHVEHQETTSHNLHSSSNRESLACLTKSSPPIEVAKTLLRIPAKFNNFSLRRLKTSRKRSGPQKTRTDAHHPANWERRSSCDTVLLLQCCATGVCHCHSNTLSASRACILLDLENHMARFGSNWQKSSGPTSTRTPVRSRERVGWGSAPLVVACFATRSTVIILGSQLSGS